MEKKLKNFSELSKISKLNEFKKIIKKDILNEDLKESDRNDNNVKILKCDIECEKSKILLIEHPDEALKVKIKG